jgi:hypothetical protein
MLRVGTALPPLRGDSPLGWAFKKKNAESL